jgi:dihydropteroate synthase
MEPKDTFFCSKKTLNCRGRLIELSGPVVMGILNVTTDSFYAKSRISNESLLLETVEKMVSDGALIVDIGACSTRPGSLPVPVEEELSRVKKTVEVLRASFPELILSVDTFRSEVARAALQEGADVINDVYAGAFDMKIWEVVAEFECPYVISHMQGTPETMQKNPTYSNVVSEVIGWLQEKVYMLQKKGIKDIIIDPGFGFGKTLEHNYTILKNLELFKAIGVPVMAGLSRKGMINKVLGTEPVTALNGTTIANTVALMNGADILRVHDVKEAVEAVKLVSFYKQVT